MTRQNVQNYVDDVARYASNVNEDVVEKIVNYLSIALENRDSRYVASSDHKELEYVCKNWAQKILGADEKSADEAVDEIACRMREDRHKSRVTFYYLLAEKLKALDKINKLP